METEDREVSTILVRLAELVAYAESQTYTAPDADET